MRRYLLALVLTGTLAAQTAKFPGAVATNQDLSVAKDRSATTLSSGVDGSTLSIPVASSATFTANEIVTIDAEQMMVCTVGAGTLTICSGQRGFNGTSATSHTSGTAVRGQITAWHHNALAAEVKALEGNVPVVINIKSYGAVGDGITDDSSAIQAALDAGPAKVIYFPAGTYLACSLLVHSNTVLVGGGFSKISTASGGPRDPISLLKCSSAAPIIGQYDATSYSVTIRGLGLQGAGATSGSKGIYLTDAWDWTIEDNFLESFGDSCIQWVGGVSGTVRHNIMQNCVLVRTGRSAYIGALDIGTTDAFVTGNEATASFSSATGQAVDGWIAACVARGANSFWTNNICELSEVGMVVESTGGPSRVVGNRGDLNQTYGFVILGAQIQMIGNSSFRNSRDTDNTYDGFLLTAGSQTITMIGNAAAELDGDSVRMRYGIHDSSAVTPSAELANFYSGNTSYGLRGSNLYFDAANTKRVPLELKLANDAVGAVSATNQFIWDPTNIRFGLSQDGAAPGGTFTVRRTSTENANILIDSYQVPMLKFLDRAQSSGERAWSIRTGAGTSDLLFSANSDDFSGEGPYMQVLRSGASPTVVSMPTPLTVGLVLGSWDGTSSLQFGGEGRSNGIAFGSLGTPAAGAFVWCTDCTVGATCTGTGSGAWAFRTASLWTCPF